MSDVKIKELHSHLEEMARRQRENKLEHYAPYPKQLKFHELGSTHRERMFMAGNQLGKTWSGGMEMAMHLTGMYPEWWKGRTFTSPIRAWAAGVTGESTRDNPQRILLGPLGMQGSGAIPKASILEVRNGRGLPDAIDNVLVKHRAGGVSQLAFKSYEKGREKWQGETLNLIWLDEEPPMDIYSEALARISALDGLVYLTATPLLGMSEVVRRYMSSGTPDRTYVQMTIDDAGHISPEMRDKIIEGYPEHEREARTKGVPMLGSGRVFPVAESSITEPALELPRHWPRLCGIDFGWDHPTAAVWLAWDRDSDIVHIYDVYRVKQASAITHAAAIRARGDWIKVAWPHDGHQTDKGSGEGLSAIYKQQGCKMLHEHAQTEEGGNSVEASVMDMLNRMQTGRLKIASHLQDWFEEFRMYHRKDGRLVKEADDLLSATRYALMMLRHARTAEEAGQRKVRMAEDVNYDILGETEKSMARSGVVWGNGRPAHMTETKRTAASSHADYDIFN